MSSRVASLVLAVISFISLLLARILLNASVSALMYSFIVTKTNFIVEKINTIIASFRTIDFFTCLYLSGFLTAISITSSFIAIQKTKNRDEVWRDIKIPVFIALFSSISAEILTIILVDILHVAYETNIFFHKMPSRILFYLSGFIINITTLLVVFSITSSTYSLVKNKVKYPQVIRISYIIGFWIIASIFILDLINDVFVAFKIFMFSS
ncbi:MAG: hypothetical protein J7K23_07300 [Thermoproteales archaeon]|nr:hypothetical protein [Thermoproteales archaeon]